MQQAMSPTDLAAVRHKWQCIVAGRVTIPNHDIRRLLAEVERLRLLNEGLIERAAAQAEVLGRLANRTRLTCDCGKEWVPAELAKGKEVGRPEKYAGA